MVDDTIVQRIVLEGADEVERQLADIGEAGRQAFEDVNQAAEELGSFDALDPSKVMEHIEKLRDVSTEAFNRIKQSVEAVGGSFEQIHPGVLQNRLNDLGVASEQAFAKIKQLAESAGGFDKLDP